MNQKLNKKVYKECPVRKEICIKDKCELFEQECYYIVDWDNAVVDILNGTCPEGKLTGGINGSRPKCCSPTCNSFVEHGGCTLPSSGGEYHTPEETMNGW